MRELRPHVVITMGTEGAITAHPDHSMISVFATMACHWAGRTNRFPDQLENGLAPHRTQKLYYATALFTMPPGPMRHFELPWPDPLPFLAKPRQARQPVIAPRVVVRDQPALPSMVDAVDRDRGNDIGLDRAERLILRWKTQAVDHHQVARR